MAWLRQGGGREADHPDVEALAERTGQPAEAIQRELETLVAEGRSWEGALAVLKSKYLRPRSRYRVLTLSPLEWGDSPPSAIPPVGLQAGGMASRGVLGRVNSPPFQPPWD